MDDDYWILLLIGLGLGVLIALSLKQTQSLQQQPLVYENLEEWEIVHDRRGRVVGVKAKRRAEERNVR